MQLFKHIDRINLLDKLIRQKRTGTPNELARRLGLSVSRVYSLIDDLKDRGAPICYSRQLGSYFYDLEYSIKITVDITSLDDNKIYNISGGQKIFSNFYFPTVFIE
ncbi:HTH domain-containing protein [Sphingobacterium oryzagri]|uniref:HTH domain-containing protein n=1 Tax=Sphingobacterium oryzagri TaxID=3025669 RepID=A0ABY7WKH4_9SPHI|nr:HTH domain-containing protein [Sphingobacterium sp. KACC 22765]WDF69480.1 HTH domain-containing protein [Sphingobacterium sp. KACC 22765]